MEWSILSNLPWLSCSCVSFNMGDWSWSHSWTIRTYYDNPPQARWRRKGSTWSSQVHSYEAPPVGNSQKSCQNSAKFKVVAFHPPTRRSTDQDNLWESFPPTWASAKDVYNQNSHVESGPDWTCIPSNQSNRCFLERAQSAWNEAMSTESDPRNPTIPGTWTMEMVHGWSTQS